MDTFHILLHVVVYIRHISIRLQTVYTHLLIECTDMVLLYLIALDEDVEFFYFFDFEIVYVSAAPCVVPAELPAKLLEQSAELI